MTRIRALVVVAAVAAAIAGAARASAPPVGPLPAGPTSTIQTQKGELVAFALPKRANGRVWRFANASQSGALQQVAEADVGSTVVLVFRAHKTGTTTIAFGLTRGETAKAYESRRYIVRVS
jgi:hypothetical protein